MKAEASNRRRIDPNIQLIAISLEKIHQIYYYRRIVEIMWVNQNIQYKGQNGIPYYIILTIELKRYEHNWKVRNLYMID